MQSRPLSFGTPYMKIRLFIIASTQFFPQHVLSVLLLLFSSILLLGILLHFIVVLFLNVIYLPHCSPEMFLSRLNQVKLLVLKSTVSIKVIIIIKSITMYICKYILQISM